MDVDDIIINSNIAAYKKNVYCNMIKQKRSWISHKRNNWNLEACVVYIYRSTTSMSKTSIMSEQYVWLCETSTIKTSA